MDLGGSSSGPRIDARAVGLAVLAEVAVAATIVVASLPLGTQLVVPVVGAVAAGVLSRNFEEEFFDGAIAAGVSPVIVPVVGLVIAWLFDPAMSGQLAVNLGSVIFSVALPVILLAITMTGILGAVLSHQVASIHRRAKAGVEIK